MLRISADALVWEAARLMARADVGAVVVTRDDGGWGILSERDVVRNVVARGLDPAQVRVRDAMLSAAPRVSAHAAVEATMAYLVHLRRRHAVVTHADRLMGVVSLGELAEHTTAELEVNLEELVRYVGSERGPKRD